MNLYPQPNRPGVGPNDLNNYAAGGPGNTLNDKMDTRVDWEQNAVHRMFFRFSDRFRQDQLVPCFFCNGADTGVNQYNNGFQAVINATVTPSPSWVINTYLSYSRWQEQHIAQGYGVASASTIGLSDSLFQAPILPAIYPDGGYSSLGSSSYEKYIRGSDTVQVNLTKVIGRHTLKSALTSTIKPSTVFKTLQETLLQQCADILRSEPRSAMYGPELHFYGEWQRDRLHTTRHR